jgi:hypothetical protein
MSEPRVRNAERITKPPRLAKDEIGSFGASIERRELPGGYRSQLSSLSLPLCCVLAGLVPMMTPFFLISRG